MSNSFFHTLRQQKKIVVVILGIICLLSYRAFQGQKQTPRPESAYPVRVATAERKDMPVYFKGLGTATAANTVLVKSRVDGELIKIHFAEGQEVAAGELLAEIDSRPFQIQLSQAEGAYARDKALLEDAKQTLVRYRKLYQEQSVSQQQLQSQAALVGQYEGALQIDAANIAEAKLQITYSQITAPISGQVGLKKVDAGNMVRANDANGIVSITQNDPMHVVFTLLERQIPDVLQAFHTGKPLVVEAYDQLDSKKLGTGSLISLDNQIDVATGTVKAKASFPNKEHLFYPNQFLNVHILVKVQEAVLTIPNAAIQRDNTGFFVYTVSPLASPTHSKANEHRATTIGDTNSTKPQATPPQKRQGVVTLKRVETGYASPTETIITSGLQDDELVVTDGVDKLRDQAAVLY